MTPCFWMWWQSSDEQQTNAHLCCRLFLLAGSRKEITTNYCGYKYKSRNFCKVVLSIKFLKYVVFLIEYTGLCHADWLNFLIQSCQLVWQNVTMTPEVKLRPLFTNYRDAIPRCVVSVASYLCRSIDYNCLKNRYGITLQGYLATPESFRPVI